MDVNRALGYQTAVWAVADHPLLGQGFQTTRATMNDEVVHNGYLQLSADLGVPAGIALVALFTIPLWRMGRTIRTTLKAPSSAIDYGELTQESIAFFAVLALAVKLCFHPVGTVVQDWIFFMAAAPRFYLSSPTRCLRSGYDSSSR
jgi:O-antigen ligase